MTFAFIARHRHIWPVRWLCEVLAVSRSGVHAWPGRPASARAIEDAKRVIAIDKRLNASDRTHGPRRVWHGVLVDGRACGLHRIERLMRRNAMRARPKRRGKPRDDGERSVIADSIPDRDFEADRPKRKWLADFTHIWTVEGWRHVAVVRDRLSRRVVGWSMQADRDASRVMDALMMTVWRRGKADALLHHSDQGAQCDLRVECAPAGGHDHAGSLTGGQFRMPIDSLATWPRPGPCWRPRRHASRSSV
ncbi:IS3 family transposase [Rhodobaculum claviforme]|nr:IS3 family transposase [Rhodobaculum claviforme]